jgi:rubrerythrin
MVGEDPERAAAADPPIVMTRYTLTVWDWLAPRFWTCPGCAAVMLTRSPSPRCPRCGAQEDE